MFLKTMAGGLMLMTMGCQAIPPEDRDELIREISQGGCNANAVQDLIGQPATAELGGIARTRSGAQTVRWIRPGDMVTMDHRSDRLNINIDERGRVNRINCG